jgi:hypothetical protein
LELCPGLLPLPLLPLLQMLLPPLLPLLLTHDNTAASKHILCLQCQRVGCVPTWSSLV